MSATWTWRSAGSSKVEEMTSALTFSSMSVTSSGRSSMSSTMRTISGWFSLMALASFCIRMVLPALGGATIRARWPLPSGESRSTTRMRQVAVLPLQPDPRVGIARPQVVERDPVLGLLRLLEVDLLDLEQREVPLALLGRPDLPHDRVAGAEVEPLDLAGGDVDVVGAVQVVPVLAAEEAVAFGQDLQHALAPDDGVRVEERLLDAEDQVLLPEAGVVGDVQLLGQRMQLCDRLLLQLSDIHGLDSRRAGPTGRPAGGGKASDVEGSARLRRRCMKGDWVMSEAPETGACGTGCDGEFPANPRSSST